MVGEGGISRGLPYPAKRYGKSRPLAGVNIGGTGLVWCTPAMSISSVASESYRPMIYVSPVTYGKAQGLARGL